MGSHAQTRGLWLRACSGQRVRLIDERCDVIDLCQQDRSKGRTLSLPHRGESGQKRVDIGQKHLGVGQAHLGPIEQAAQPHDLGRAGRAQRDAHRHRRRFDPQDLCQRMRKPGVINAIAGTAALAADPQ